MAARDIMPFAAVQTGGSHDRVRHFRMGALTTNSTEDTSWNIGEALLLDASASDINEATDGTFDPSTGLLYLAAAGSEELISMNGGTSGATTHDITVPVYDFRSGSFITRNIFNNSDTNLGPAGDGTMTGCTIGADADIWVNDSAAAHVHGLDLNGDYFTITRILDVNGEDTFLSGGTPYAVVFERLD